MASREFPEYAAPIPVRGGIRARSERGSIGETWWSRRFIDVLESFADRNRLHRGRAYARRGQVIDLKVRPYEVSARVQGSRPEPYEVAVGIAAIGEDAWRVVEAELASRSAYRALLLAGEMPKEIEWLFAELDIPLFPESAHDLHLMCDCPDYGDPCKHTAAVLYLLAEAFDRDPFLLLEWKGRPRERLLAGLRRGNADAAPDPFDVGDEPLTATGFWAPGAPWADLRGDRPAVPTPPDLLLQLLDPPPVKVRRRPLIDALAPAYEAMPDA
ncbi:SWIM zinc finger family protein [Thermomonospora cellulosilytica]|uniref:Putative Zn finger protein n=1 Tax=Thermomonospora cellulosilytica TaxID=1411118 RepID=A0A7W3N4K4_9ACTN|nr:SWIM zinc finger family protein [Thermomonospora cellulosilytica]MBA9007353.1 putative Zn finger protein [Thermomonospora cellulosilytica]